MIFFNSIFTDFMEKPAFNIQMAAESNIGLHRSGNEDSFLVFNRNGTFAIGCVADGIGSHSDGKFASSICCRDLLAQALDDSVDKREPETFLRTFFNNVHEKIFERNYREKRPLPMGCTAVAAFFTRDDVTVLNVGDSRFYEFLPGREQPLKQITVDHHPDDELLTRLSRTYQVDKEKLMHRVLLHSLGTRHQLVPDVFTLVPQPGAKYLLCSDGLSGFVSEERIGAILADETLSVRQLTSALLREALLCGGRDNITVITAQYSGEDNGIA